MVALDAETGREIWKTDLHLSRDGNYSDLSEFAIRANIEGLEKRLVPAEFTRVSRGAIEAMPATAPAKPRV